MKKRIYKYLIECLREIIGIFEYLVGITIFVFPEI